MVLIASIAKTCITVLIIKNKIIVQEIAEVHCKLANNQKNKHYFFTLVLKKILFNTFKAIVLWASIVLSL